MMDFAELAPMRQCPPVLPVSLSTRSSVPRSCAMPPGTGTSRRSPPRSGSDEFDFEYGDEFGEHIKAFDPTFCKVLVRYNPGDAALNQRQAGG